MNEKDFVQRQLEERCKKKKMERTDLYLLVK